jgi:ubiquinone/menaquinone biosynthesis C-methylase UbiE
MNENHAKLCSSPEWADWLQSELLASLADGIELGEDMLEVGPGPGAATEWLRDKVDRLVALEIDPATARLLAERFAGENVEVVIGDATSMDLPDASFDSVGSFTMLHHVPGTRAQAAVLGEMFRVLRPGGVLLLSDSLASEELHHFHADDSYNPVDPGFLLAVARALGFSELTLRIGDVLSLVARKPERTSATALAPGREGAARESTASGEKGRVR